MSVMAGLTRTGTVTSQQRGQVVVGLQPQTRGFSVFSVKRRMLSMNTTICDWKIRSGDGEMGDRLEQQQRWTSSAGGGQEKKQSSSPQGRMMSGVEGEQSRPRVCILGGGFGGLYTAVKLEQLMWPAGKRPRVTLVDKAERFSFKPLLYEVLTDTAMEDEVAPQYDRLLGSYSVNFVRGEVAAVEPGDVAEKGGHVSLVSGEKLPFDWLVLALGASTNTFGIPGVKEYAVPFSVYEDAVKVKRELERLHQEPRFPEILIVGGGYAGIELAASIAEKLRGEAKIQVVTASDDILPTAPGGQRDAAQKALLDDGVVVTTKTMVKKIEVAGGNVNGNIEGKKRLVFVEDGEQRSDLLEADLVVWTAGQQPSLASKADDAIPFPRNTRGATKTDATLRVLENNRVFALGDVAVANNDELSNLPATAQVAFQQADYVAWNIWASINKKPLLRFQYQHLGDMMSLGARKGAVSLPIPVPPPVSAALQAGPVGGLLRTAGITVQTTYAGASDGVTVEGPLGALLRRAAYLYRQPTDVQRLSVLRSWTDLFAKQARSLARDSVTGKKNE